MLLYPCEIISLTKVLTLDLQSQDVYKVSNWWNILPFSQSKPGFEMDWKGWQPIQCEGIRWYSSK